MNNHEQLTLVLQQHFESEPQVLEVALYIVSTLTISDAVLNGMLRKDTELLGIPPEAYYLVKRFDNGLTTNKFFLDNFAPIKMQLVLADIKLNSLTGYLCYKNTDDKKYVRITDDQIKAIILTRLDALTTVAFLWKGVEFAEDFDRKMRVASHMSVEHDQYFKARGI